MKQTPKPTKAMKGENLTMNGLVRNAKDCMKSEISFNDWSKGMKTEYDLTNAHISYVKNKLSNKPTISIPNFAHAIITNALYNQVGRLYMTCVKKSTLTALVRDLVPAIIKDGSTFDDNDRKDFKKYKEPVIKEIVKQLKGMED